MLSITRLVHASVLLQFGDVAILTDPWFSERPGYYWGEPLGMALENLPRLAGVVVSHDHYDHYDMDAFAAYPDKQVPFVVRQGTGEKARRQGFARVSELAPWESVQIGAVTVTAAPAKHSVPQNTYLLQAGGKTVYFGGDTLMIPELNEVASRFPRIDLAILPTNGLAIRPLLNRKVVMDAQDAADLCAVLKPRVAVPMHYAYTAGPLRDRLLLKMDRNPQSFVQAVARTAPATAVKVLEPGERLAL